MSDVGGAPAIVAVGLAMCLSLGTSSGFRTDLGLERIQPATGWLTIEVPPPNSLVIPPVIVPPPANAASDTLSMSALLASIHNESGLTWDQIARLFNVSRRSVHLWMAGGRMSAANEERLVALATQIASIDGDPDARRHHLLTSTDAGLSFFDTVRREAASGPNDINRHVEPLTSLG